MNVAPNIPRALFTLRDQFQANGFDIKIVGGAVRDMFTNDPTVIHDVDLCTDATPDEQQDIYDKYDVRYITTGLRHGTITIVLNGETYEITSLRTETDCDGRHATVSYTHDWELDLSRRDLTFNAMNMTFEGEVTDPYNGIDDLKNGRVRFVGVAGERMREDYLRILRWFRFHARIAKGKFSLCDIETCAAIIENMHGLQKISRERVWSEMKRLLADPNGLPEILEIIRLGVAEHIDLPVPSQYNHVSFLRLERAHKNTKDPITLMAAYLGSVDEVKKLSMLWKWSSDETKQASSIAVVVNTPYITLDKLKKTVVINEVNKDWVVQAALALDMRFYASGLNDWSVPVFPITGDDLLKLGYRPGKEFGAILATLRGVWADGKYLAGKDELLKTVSANCV